VLLLQGQPARQRWLVRLAAQARLLQLLLRPCQM
jgi:hypothetical protein